MAGEAPEAGGAHGDDDAQVAPLVGVQQHQDGGAPARGEAVPEREGRGLVGAEPGYGGL